MFYKEQLTQSEWYEKRELIKLRDLNKCTKCNSRDKLAVHHTYYKNGLKAWEYPDESLITLCDKCHTEIHNKETLTQNPFTENLSISCKAFGNGMREDIAKTTLYLIPENRDLLLCLKEKTLKLFLIISSYLRPNEDTILINETYYLKLLKLRNKKELRALISELENNNLLATSESKDTYWVNPSVLFNGNRILKYPNSLKSR
jgi:hypothetical protein